MSEYELRQYYSPAHTITVEQAHYLADTASMDLVKARVHGRIDKLVKDLSITDFTAQMRNKEWKVFSGPHLAFYMYTNPAEEYFSDKQ